MGDTLRSIAEGMEHEEIRLTDGSNLEIAHRFAVPSCPKCRLEALRAEYERVDLVKCISQHDKALVAAAGGHILVACKCGMEFESHIAKTPDADAKWSKHRADVIETWLAMNLERIAGASAIEAQAKEKP